MAEMPEEEPIISRILAIQKLIRDILVNIVANLVAAAVIYLAGVAFGYFESSPVLVGTAIVFVAAVGFSVVATWTGGIDYIMSSGHSGKIEKAKNKIMYGCGALFIPPIVLGLMYLGESFGSVLINYRRPAEIFLFAIACIFSELYILRPVLKSLQVSVNLIFVFILVRFAILCILAGVAYGLAGHPGL